MGIFKPPKPDQPRPRGYLCSDTDLYWVEHTYADRAVLEDCRSGALIDVPLSYLTRLRPVDGGSRVRLARPRLVAPGV
jgi:hypothetical protein